MASVTENRRRLLHIALYTLFLFLLTITTLSFGISYGRSTFCPFTQPAVQECPRTAISPMWDTEHVPNPPPVYTPKVFQPISNIKSFTSRELAIKDKSWNDILSGDFINVELSNGEITNYGVSMFHQMHCLNMIRQMLLNQPMSRALETEDWTDDDMHWLHCLDYLAQGILCAADDTLEKKTFIKNFQGRNVSGIDGMNHTHQCRNSERLISVVMNSEKAPVRESTLGATTVFPIAGRDREGKAWLVSES